MKTEKTQAGHPSILFVDDNVLLSTALSDALTHTGYDCFCAHSLKEGWRFLHALKPAVVVLDLKLVDGNGLDFLKRMRAHPALRSVPVLVLSAYKDTPHIRSAMKAGANRYAFKPTRIALLKPIIAALTQSRESVRRRSAEPERVLAAAGGTRHDA